MSWNADRFRQECNEDDAKRERRARREKLTLISAGHYYESKGLESVFRTASLEHALMVLLRLKRMKRRFQGAPCPPPFAERKREGYNYHHLTPQCKRRVAYHGGGSRNMLYIRISRHVSWHQVFGVLTLEEIILILAGCYRVARDLWITTERTPVRKRVIDRRRERRHRRHISAFLSAREDHEVQPWEIPGAFCLVLFLSNCPPGRNRTHIKALEEPCSIH